jgi:hypothetical protein
MSPPSRQELAIALVAVAWGAVALVASPPTTGLLGVALMTSALALASPGMGPWLSALALRRIDHDGGRPELNPSDGR